MICGNNEKDFYLFMWITWGNRKNTDIKLIISLSSAFHFLMVDGIYFFPGEWFPPGFFYLGGLII